MPLRVDVSEDSNEEGGWVPLGTQLPPAGLTKLQGRVGQGKGSAVCSLWLPALTQGRDTAAQCSRQHRGLQA